MPRHHGDSYPSQINDGTQYLRHHNSCDNKSNVDIQDIVGFT